MSFNDGVIGSLCYSGIQCITDDYKNVSKDTIIIGFAGGYLGGYFLNGFLPSPLLGPIFGILLFDYLLFM